jgi:hypothetical protein
MAALPKGALATVLLGARAVLVEGTEARLKDLRGSRVDVRG